jgi:chemotaxis protein methyltransferase CheR
MKPELILSEDQIKELSHLIAVWTGNSVGVDRRTLMESRIFKRLRETELSPTDYIRLIKQDAIEREHFISAFTTHKTDWFREPIHFDFLSNVTGDGKLRECIQPLAIWSAACSTGEEVYSICINLYENKMTHFRVLGSDISESCLQQAAAGIYNRQKVTQQVPPHLREKYFNPAPNDNSNALKTHSAFERHLKWRKFNLLESQLNTTMSFDIIFLRNVLIYFSPADIERIIARLRPHLKKQGHLIIGVSESLPETKWLKKVGQSIYQVIE